MARTQHLAPLVAFAAASVSGAHIAPAWGAPDGQGADGTSPTRANEAVPGRDEPAADASDAPPGAAIELGAGYSEAIPIGHLDPLTPMTSIAGLAHSLGAEAGYRMPGGLALSGRWSLGYFLPDGWFGSRCYDFDCWVQLANAGLWATYSGSTRDVYLNWVGIGVGGEWLTAGASVETATGRGYKAGLSASAFPVVSSELGLRVWGGRRWALGLYLGIEAGKYSSVSLRCDGDDCPAHFADGNLQRSAWHVWFSVGARIVSVLPLSSLAAARQRGQCERRGGRWDATSGACDTSIPPSPPSPEEECVANGGIWRGKDAGCDD
jgi:hypothetical protein